MHPADQTTCAYYWLAVVMGVLAPDAAREWAFTRIDAIDAPPIAIIEVATACNRIEVIDTLRAAVQDGADWPLAGRRVLCEIHRLLAAGELPARRASELAAEVAWMAKVPEDVFHTFEELEHALQTALDGVWGDPDALAMELREALQLHGVDAVAAP